MRDTDGRVPIQICSAAGISRVTPSSMSRIDDRQMVVQQAWHVLEPQMRFMTGIHFQELCGHPQAVTEGRIQESDHQHAPGTFSARIALHPTPTHRSPVSTERPCGSLGQIDIDS